MLATHKSPTSRWVEWAGSSSWVDAAERECRQIIKYYMEHIIHEICHPLTPRAHGQPSEYEYHHQTFMLRRHRRRGRPGNTHTHMLSSYDWLYLFGVFVVVIPFRRPKCTRSPGATFNPLLLFQPLVLKHYYLLFGVISSPRSSCSCLCVCLLVVRLRNTHPHTCTLY